MENGYNEKEVIVHPVDGMQLSEGTIRVNAGRNCIGSLPGMAVSVGKTIDEVLQCMDRFVKDYYGEDVIVEVVQRSVAV